MMATQGNKDMINPALYGAIVRKDGYTWSADLYKDGKLFYKSWFYGFKTKKSLYREIEALGIHYGKY